MRAEDILPDHIDHGRFGGVTIRKGSVAAFLANARIVRDAGIDATAPEVIAAREDLVALVPSLHALGLFDILAVRDPALRALVAQASNVGAESA